MDQSSLSRARPAPMTAGPGARPAPEQIAATVRGAQHGDLMALHDLLDLITPYVQRLCGPIALADGPDAAQEALIVVLRNLRSLRTPEALFGWVRVIAVREAVRVARRSARTVPAELGEIPAPGDPALAVDVADVLRRLAPEHRAVLMLRDLEGFDEARAAQLLGVPTGTVRSRLFRARRMFRRAWLADRPPPDRYPHPPAVRAGRREAGRTEEHASERPSTEERSSGRRPTEERSSGRRPTEERPFERRPTEESASERPSTGERSSGRRPTEESPTEARPGRARRTERRPR
ncbi:sigma factor-like helix-turn-helix DNA-binding protein [Actinocatenispora sera]|uniref:sigma factor-like helix-turn-helix DNA-binding protein n=1 Tax=Actinocatenispora sera TaxID=390989 RepID=UPI0033EC0E17